MNIQTDLWIDRDDKIGIRTSGKPMESGNAFVTLEFNGTKGMTIFGTLDKLKDLHDVLGNAIAAMQEKCVPAAASAGEILAAEGVATNV